MSSVLTGTTATNTELSLFRTNLLRAGYLFMGLGLAFAKWPLLPGVHELPLYEGVTLCILTAMSLLALLGLRHPLRLLPILLFETTWKVLWLGVVAVPQAATDGMDGATTKVAFNCYFVVIVIAVIPWNLVWRNYIRGTASAAAVPSDSRSR